MVDLLYQHAVDGLTETEMTNVIAAGKGYSGMGEWVRCTTLEDDGGNYQVAAIFEATNSAFSDASTFASDLDTAMPAAWDGITESDIETR